MGSSKIKVIHVIIIAIVICVGTVVGFYMMLIKKANEDIVKAQARYDTAKTVADQRGEAERQLAQAKADFSVLVSKYEKLMNEKMPPISLADRMGGWMAVIDELADNLGPKVEAWPKKSKVKLISGISVPAPPSDPNSVQTDMIVVPLGNLTVQGSFAQIMAHIRSWNKFDRLVQVDPVSLSGHSPNMTGQYNLTVYLFPRGQAGPLVSMMSGGAAVTGAGASATGPSMGAMGGFSGAAMKGGPGMKGMQMKGMKGMKGGARVKRERKK
jgi:hypothetical protein